MAKKIKILMADWDLLLIDAVRSLLDQKRIELVATSDGESFLELLYCFNPNLIILDLMLLNMNIEDICKKIRKNSKAILLIATAVDDEKSILSAFNNGADDYVIKPINPMELAARISALLRRATSYGILPTDTSLEIHSSLTDNYIDRRSKNMVPQN